MGIQSNDLSWIVVSDLKKARKFYSETLGLKEMTYDEKCGWMEFQGKEGGATIGISQINEHCPLPAGANAVITLTVDDIEQSVKELKKKGVAMMGDIMEVPGHVKLQLIKDNDGNLFQLAETLN